MFKRKKTAVPTTPEEDALLLRENAIGRNSSIEESEDPILDEINTRAPQKFNALTAGALFGETLRKIPDDSEKLIQHKARGTKTS
jgi:hypothetical protein